MTTPIAPDCFAGAGGMMTLDAALAMVAERIVPVTAVERVNHAAARGRILAADIVAGRDNPGFDAAAVDGYAMPAAGEARRRVVERVPAGARPGTGLAAGDAARIFTGAPLPEGADAVVMQEHVGAPDAAGLLTLSSLPEPGRNVRHRGEDFGAGDILIPAGHRLGPREAALAAAAGHGELAVRAPLRIAVFSTGDELVEAGAAAEPGKTPDVNRPMLATALSALPVEVTDLGILADDPAVVRRGLSAAAEEHDVVLTTGGVSVGEEDHVRDAVTTLGRLDFWRLAVKPGKPLALGRLGDAVFVGLPGNPVASLVLFLVFVRPLLLRLGGGSPAPPPPLVLPSAGALRKQAGRREWLVACFEHEGTGSRVRALPGQGSHRVATLHAGDGLIDLPEPVSRIEPGEPVAFLPFALYGL